MSNVARVYVGLGKYSQAEDLLSQLLPIRSRVLGPEHPRTLNSMGQVADLCSAQNKYPQAEALLSQAVEIRSRTLGAEHPDTLGDKAGLDESFRMQGKYAQAETILSQTVEAQRRVLGPEHRTTMESEIGLVLTWQNQGKFAASEPMIRQVLEIQRRKRADDWQRFQAEGLLGVSLMGQEKYAEAEPLLLAGFRGMAARKDRMSVPDQRLLDTARQSIVQLYRAWGKPLEVARWKSG